MKTLKLLAILFLVGIFYSCEDEVDELCQGDCAEVVDYRLHRKFSVNQQPWSYTFVLTLKMPCSDEEFEFITGVYDNVDDVTRLEEVCRSYFIKYN